MELKQQFVPNKSLSLGIETSSPQGSLCLYQNSKLLGERRWFRDKPHSEWISWQLQELLSDANQQIHNITLICLGVGPGSFTGLRVGINMARAIAYSLNIPILPVGSLALLARNAPDDQHPIVCMVNAFKSLVYVTKFKNFETLLSSPINIPQALALDKLKTLIQQPVYPLGDGFDVYSEFLPSEIKPHLKKSPAIAKYPDARHLNFWLESNDLANRLITWQNLLPLYIRKSAPEEKLELERHINDIK